MALLVECIWCKELYSKEKTTVIKYVDTNTNEAKTAYACKDCMNIISNSKINDKLEV